MGRGLHTVLVRRRAPPPSLVRALLRQAGVGSPCGRDTRGSRRLGALGRAVCRSSRIPPPPPPASRSLLGEGGRRVAPVAPKLGGWDGGAAPPPPPPRRASACHPLSAACPPGYTRAVGFARRPRASGAARSAGNGSVRRGGGRGGSPPALVRAPVFSGPASDRAAPFGPSWAAGRARGRLPLLWCPRSPGAAASSGGVRCRRFFCLPLSALGPEWQGGGGGGGGLWSPGAAS